MLRKLLISASAASLLLFAAACEPMPAPEDNDGTEAVESADPAPNTLSSSERASGWQLLFDGQTLDGWEQRTTSQPDATPDWSVQDGALLCGGTAASWIHTNEEFGDYMLNLQFRGPAMVNSGVFLRSQKEGQPHVTGYELQVWDEQPGGYNNGSLVNHVVAEPALMIPDEWNQYEISAIGDHFVVVLNGETILDAHDATHAAGVVGLQCQPEQRIEFRNIKLMAH